MFQPDAAVAAALGRRGDACTVDSCAGPLACSPLPGGYCASHCSAATPCDGRCVDTARLGDVCTKACTSDAECRADEGYICDREWRACLVPHLAVLLPKQCPTNTPARDPAFGDSAELTGATSSVATLAGDGSIEAAEAITPSLGPAFEPTECAPPSGCERMHATATKTRDGRLHVVSLRGGLVGGFGSAQYAVEYTVSSDGGETYSPPVAISARDEMLPFYFAKPALAVDVRRKWIYAAYVRGGRDARWDIVIAASKDNGATWKRTLLAGDGCAIHMVPTLALDPTTGTLHAAYYDSEGAVGRFAHGSCGPGVTKCKLHGAINRVPFATLSTAREPTKSLGDVQTLLVDDKRRILHAVWAQRVDDAGKPVVRFFHAQAKLKK